MLPDQLYTSNNPNNLLFGAVADTYRISKHEVTNDQYAEFLNNVAASDPNDLFNANMDITQSGSSGSFHLCGEYRIWSESGQLRIVL